MVYSQRGGDTKPHPALYQLACERLDVTPEEALFVDDQPENLSGARRVGMKPVLFDTNRQAVPEIQAHLATR